MKKILILACLAGVLATPLVLAAEPSAEQIADNNAAARGGLAAWRAVSSMRLAGQMDAGGKPVVRLPFEMSLKRPHKSRLDLHVKEQTAVQVYDGQQGWKLRPYLNRDDVEDFTPEEARAAADDADLDGPLIDHAAKGTRVALAGTEMVEGRKTYKLQLTRADGRQSKLWIDAATYLDVKIEGQPRRLDNKIHKVVVYYRDFKTVDGLKIPMTLETAVEGVHDTRKISFQTVTVNPPLAEALFAKPQPQPEATRQASAR